MKAIKANFQTSLVENGIYKIIAMIITLILWFTVLSRRDITIQRIVDLEFVLGDHLILMNDVKPSVEFRINGSRPAIKKIQAEDSKPLLIDISHVEPGKRVVSIPENALDLPPGAKVVALNPTRILLDLQPLVSRWIPVEVRWMNEKLSSSFQVTRIEPAGFEVRGAKSVLERTRGLWTQILNLSHQQTGVSDKFEIRTRLEKIEEPGLIVPTDQEIVIWLKRRGGKSSGP